MATAPDPEDLTARARIRDAAMRHFADHGFERATIRGIAETAGVSSGLVRHHFGAKKELRDACDEWLLRMIRRLNDQLLEDIIEGELRTQVAAARAAMMPHQRYLARALTEGAAGALFDEMVTMSEQWLAVYDRNNPDASEVDRRSRAAIITAMGLAIPMLYPHVSRAMGVDLATPEGDRLLSATLLHIYSHPLLTPEEAATLRTGLEKMERGEPR
jgi:AcrR family transcriptional regulator